MSRVRYGPVPIHAPTSSGTANRYVRHFPARILIKDQDARILPDLSASAIVQLPAVERGVIVPRGDMLPNSRTNVP